MAVLIVAEIKNNSIKKISRELASAARKISDKVIALIVNGSDDHAGELFTAGADVVVKGNLDEYSPESMAEIIAQIASEQDIKVVLIPHSLQGKDYAGRVAVKMSGTVMADVVEIGGTIDSIEVKKPIYSGKAYANMKVASPAVITIRPNSQEITSYSGPETIEASGTSPAGGTPLKDLDLSGGDEVQLTDASVIVSGGRGIKGPENWPVLKELQQTLGAALGASRAAVDAGWITHDHQVGQTGKTVSPNLYIACGISGAIQHLAGMSSSKFIVAINKDPDAPIFKIATYGLVDDLFEVVPALTEELKKVLE